MSANQYVGELFENLKERSSLRKKRTFLNDVTDHDLRPDQINEIQSEIADNWVDYKDLSPVFAHIFTATEKMDSCWIRKSLS